MVVLDPDRGVGRASVPAPWSHDHAPLDPAAFGPRAAAVVHSYFCGRDAGLTVYVRPSATLAALGCGAS